MSFAELFGTRKRVFGLSCGVVCVILRLAVLVEHRLVTDRQTHDDGIYRASVASRDKNSDFLYSITNVKYAAFVVLLTRFIASHSAASLPASCYAINK